MQGDHGREFKRKNIYMFIKKNSQWELEISDILQLKLMRPAIKVKKRRMGSGKWLDTFTGEYPQMWSFDHCPSLQPKYANTEPFLSECVGNCCC